MMRKQRLLSAIALPPLLFLFFIAPADGAEPQKPAPSMPKICATCHKAEPSTIYGYFDNVAFKANTIQVKLDDSVALLKFDPDEIKVLNSEGKTGDGEFLRKIDKNREIKIAYTEEKGGKTAVSVVVKPPVKVSDSMLISTAEVEKLVAMGPEKGKYYLYDSRPLPRFQEGAIPTAINLPFPSFDKQIDKLPQDKNAKLIFYCAGPTCSMSPGSALKAQKLGYLDIKVYKDGLPAWRTKNYAVLSPQSLKEGWLDKGIPHVLLDARKPVAAEKEHIPGAVAFPADKLAKLVKSLGEIKKNAPFIIYDAKEGKEAEKVAKALIKAKFTNVNILTGGMEAWKQASYETARGKLSAKAVYVPKPRQGEIPVAEFRKILAAIPDDVMIIDARNLGETKEGMLKGAKNISAEDITEHLAEIPKDKTIITYCSTGVRAEMAYHALKAAGYRNVKFLNATIEFDKNGGYSITKD